MSISGHKVYAPEGHRRADHPAATIHASAPRPLMYGGGQERGLRPGTLPVALIAGLGLASSLAVEEYAGRTRRCVEIRNQALSALEPLGIVMNGDADRTVSHTLNFSVPGIDSEAAIVALKDVVAVSNGSACTSQNYQPSHVLTAAGLTPEQVAGAVRVSWCHHTPAFDWAQFAERLARIQTSTHKRSS